jgi:ubiquinone/menaquinone biosynthesis C-methylase UbiE
MKRVPCPELLDTDSGTPDQVAASLQDLRNINRWFGGIGTSQSMLQSVAQSSGSHQISLLDVASGMGDLPKAVLQRLRRNGIELNVTLSDRSASHLDHSFRAVAADVLSLPFRDNSFDVVTSSLFIHHLDPEQVIACVQESLRVCRRAVLINDVVRHPLHLLLVYSGLPLFRSRLTHHDAPASVRQAYTVAEMRTMLEKIPRARVEIRPHFLFRMGVIVWKPGTPDV